ARGWEAEAMRILCTFPGRAGDLLWALPTMRAIAEAYDTPVDLLIAGEFAPMLPLLAQQPYLGQLSADPRWAMDGSAAPVPFDLGVPHDRVFHLGYRGWPTQPLPFEVYDIATLDYGLVLKPLDLRRPWITVEGPQDAVDIAVGFTEAWFELKLGLLSVIDWELEPYLVQLTPVGSRWTRVSALGPEVHGCDWLGAACMIRDAKLFFGDCSALHVLAVALGKRCILME